MKHKKPKDKKNTKEIKKATKKDIYKEMRRKQAGTLTVLEKRVRNI